MLGQISLYIIHLIQSVGYFGVYILMAMESALIPVPSEITLPFAGFLANKGSLYFPLVVIVGALGDLTGALISYGIGYFLEENIIVGIIKKYGKIFLVTEHDYEKAMHWFNRFGAKVVFFSRLIPGVRTYISLPAGLSEMSILKFITYTFLGSLIWSFSLTYIGFYLGSRWKDLEGYFRKFELAIVVLLIFAVLFYVNHKLKVIKLRK